jgi:hypothetical protein
MMAEFYPRIRRRKAMVDVFYPSGRGLYRFVIGLGSFETNRTAG